MFHLFFFPFFGTGRYRIDVRVGFGNLFGLFFFPFFGTGRYRIDVRVGFGNLFRLFDFFHRFSFPFFLNGFGLFDFFHGFGFPFFLNGFRLLFLNRVHNASRFLRFFSRYTTGNTIRERLHQPFVFVLQGRQQFFGRFSALFPVCSERTHLVVNLFAVGIVCIRMFIPRIQLATVIVIADRISRPPLFVQQFRRCHSAGVGNGGNGTSVGADKFFGTYGAVVFIKERMAGTVFVINRFAVQHAVFIIGSGLRVAVFVKAFVGKHLSVFIPRYKVGISRGVDILIIFFNRFFGFGLFIDFFIHFLNILLQRWTHESYDSLYPVFKRKKTFFRKV